VVEKGDDAFTSSQRGAQGDPSTPGETRLGSAVGQVQGRKRPSV
jgi:hypothetical protein